MASYPLQPRLVVHSWLTALIAWPLAWLLLAAAQGIGVVIAGGAWIGVAVPYGQLPWALVNEPTGAFAATNLALWSYWLSPMLGALVLALLLVPLAPVARAWTAEFLVCHVAFAGAVLGLGWAPSLGLDDGPANALDQFWHVRKLVTIGACALVGAVVLQVSVPRLAGHLWAAPGGPTRSRRLALVLLHVWVPLGGWVALTVGTGWAVPGLSVVAALIVLVGAAVAAWVWAPHAPLRAREVGAWRHLVALIVVAALATVFMIWAGRATGGRARALLWGQETSTSNVRSDMFVVPLTPRPARSAPPVR